MPTWIITRLIWRWLPEDHPWKGRKPFTFAEWRAGQTDLCLAFDVVFYVSILMIAMAIWMIWD